MARITRGTLWPVKASVAATEYDFVRSAVVCNPSVHCRPSDDIHGIIVGKIGEGSKSLCFAILASLHHAYAPLIIVDRFGGHDRRRKRGIRVSRTCASVPSSWTWTITSIAVGHRYCVKLIRFRWPRKCDITSKSKAKYSIANTIVLIGRPSRLLLGCPTVAECYHIVAVNRFRSNRRKK